MRFTFVCITGMVVQIVKAFTETSFNVNGLRYYVPHIEIVSSLELSGGMNHAYMKISGKNQRIAK